MAPAIAVGIAAVLALGAGALGAGSSGAAACGTTALRRPPTERPRYALTIRLAADLRSAAGTLRLWFEPNVATNRLVLRLWPNGPAYAASGARLTIGAVTAARHVLATSRPDPTTLVVRRRLRAHEPITLSTTWRLTLPASKGQRLHGGRYARLGSFFPLLAWNGSGWATDPPIFGPLETWTSPAADFDVRISAPPRLQVLA